MDRRLCRHASILLLALALLPLAAFAAPAPDPTYAALRAARPDGRVVPVKGLTLERDVFKFQFESGEFHFLAPVGGRTVGAVFLGHGTYRLSPATPNERRQLALASGGDRSSFETLSDEFDNLVLYFADDTAQELELPGAGPDRVAGPPGGRRLRVVPQAAEEGLPDQLPSAHPGGRPESAGADQRRLPGPDRRPEISSGPRRGRSQRRRDPGLRRRPAGGGGHALPGRRRHQGGDLVPLRPAGRGRQPPQEPREEAHRRARLHGGHHHPA